MTMYTDETIERDVALLTALNWPTMVTVTVEQEVVYGHDAP
jgi:hypothetical protein